MKKSETTACLIAGVLATSILLTGCGGGSGGGMGGLGATGASGATGTAGAPGVTTNLLDLLGSTGGVTLDAGAFGTQGINVRALTPGEAAGLTARGFTGFTDIEVLTREGEIIGINSPTSGAFGVPGVGGVLPSIGGITLPALPAGIPLNILGL